ncbi:PREDICTED: sulfotransferase 6B1-like [Odobenus rosmarus divergens]|uniref:Sulfotransferase n=1 Tax=Odobenus rosmarus divergens TaxID=9708 RepID=A0A9B0GSM4_ODORO
MSFQNQSSVLHKFKGILFSTMSSEELLNSLDFFNAREDDVFLVSYPKSGTHWIAEVIGNIPNARISLTSPIELGDISKFDELKMNCKRRVIPTHLSYNMLPVNIKQKQCKIIYIVRNPKDTAVSLFHYYRDNPNLPGIETWAAFFELFLRGDGPLSQASLRAHRSVGFLTVSRASIASSALGGDIIHRGWAGLLLPRGGGDAGGDCEPRDLFKSIKKIVTFLGINVSDSEINKIARKTSFSEMKNNAAKENCDPNHTICALTSNRNLVFRKGTQVSY